MLDLHEHPYSIVEVRHCAAEALSDLSDDELYDVMLVATELLTNAYDHGQRPCQIRFLRSEQPPFVRVEVDDTSPEPPILGRSTVTRHRGRGLVIVDRVAKAWGATMRKVGKTVWATVPRATA
ncbi:ATP-binding protein [Saccharothrix sp. ALI-22-I]|uniref:ATP-binding protein n=1 Tax=Saccharothrix sp. ALI-22-I TaxID=1933778 RepID=UPI001EE71E64|nr:ATP-binding protein [Saccharothrix sp. ALI-22-I]